VGGVAVDQHGHLLGGLTRGEGQGGGGNGRVVAGRRGRAVGEIGRASCRERGRLAVGDGEEKGSGARVALVGRHVVDAEAGGRVIVGDGALVLVVREGCDGGT